MAKPTFCRKLNLTHGSSVTVVGTISSSANYFKIEMGKDGSNLDLHFSVRFFHLNDFFKIVCNSMEDGVWGKEQKNSHFPFVPGNTIQISILFEENYFTVTLPDGYNVNFPNRTNATQIDYLGIDGDIHVTELAFA